MSEKIESFRDLKVWQEGITLVKSVYQLTKSFPKEEIYGLSSQMRRAAVSVPANISEGHSRYFIKEYLYHLSVAIGSLAELQTYLVIVEELQYASKEAIAEVYSSSRYIGKMLKNLQRALQSKNSTSSPAPDTLHLSNGSVHLAAPL